jgi:hypothetical protein
MSGLLSREHEHVPQAHQDIDILESLLFCDQFLSSNSG